MYAIFVNRGHFHGFFYSIPDGAHAEPHALFGMGYSKVAYWPVHVTVDNLSNRKYRRKGGYLAVTTKKKNLDKSSPLVQESCPTLLLMRLKKTRNHRQLPTAPLI